MRRRPPLRVCPGCGAHHYAWSENEPCAGCRDGVRENRQTLAAWAREQRDARRLARAAEEITPTPFVRGFAVNSGGGDDDPLPPSEAARRQEVIDRIESDRGH